MYVHKLEDKNTLKSSVLTFGNFDGLHMGHLHLLDMLNNESINSNLESVVLTFSPHTNAVIPKSKIFSILTPFEVKEKLFLKNTKVNYLCKISFNEQFSKLTAEEFLDLIISKYNPQTILIGYDNYFGFKKEGSYNYLVNNEKYKNIKIIKINKFLEKGDIIKSSIIKSLILNDNIEKANTYLARFYAIQGSVVEGEKIGSGLGFNTANIKLTNKKQLIPSNGVYSVNLVANGIKYMSVCNIGFCPTIKMTKVKTVEVHVIDRKISLYGQDVEVQFISFIRNEKKFKSAELLRIKIKEDIERVKKERVITSG